MDRVASSEYHDMIKKTTESLGYLLVEENAVRTKKGITIRVIIFKDEGIGLNDCESVHKALMPQLEIKGPEGIDMYLEVSSPGLNRKIKNPSEFSVFRNKPVSILIHGDSEWEKGIISDSDDSSVTIGKTDGTVTISFDEIQKAKLDYTR